MGGNTLNLVLKRMLEHFLKIQPFKKILEIQDWKRGYEAYTKKKKIETRNYTNYQKL